MKALVRLSTELTTKARGTRKRFTRRLVLNIEAALKANGLSATVIPAHSRLHLEHDDPRAIAVVCRAFGVHSVLPGWKEPFVSLENIVERGRALMIDQVRGRSFAVRARVRDGNAQFRSHDVNVALGAALAFEGKVNLDEPDVTCRVEVRDGWVFYYCEIVPGVSGLPIGTGGRATLLLSGGFDSAVAAHMMWSRGVVLTFVCCRLGGEPHERAVLEVGNRLTERWGAGLTHRVVVVPFEGLAERIRTEVQERYRQLALKHFMYQAAAAVARRTRSDAIVTGESIGQVSSQTLRNLTVLEMECRVPVLRPLVALRKDEILERARRIGTSELSEKVPEYCAMAVHKPSTSANALALREQVERLAVNIEELFDGAHWIDLPSGDEVASQPTKEPAPANAAVLDLRSEAARSSHTIAGARTVDPLTILETPALLDSTVPYLIVCDEGSRSAWFAERLCALGFRAWVRKGNAYREGTPS